MTMEKGTINVQTENIFPIIKKFLYSDHEIFLRELVSNAVDATQKLKGMAALGEYKDELGETSIEVTLDEENNTLTVSDKGIGMSADEVRKYINQIAFSSAEEFLDKFKDVEDGKSIIGHFGLGFYSSFMVADKVEIITKSFRDEPAVRWECDGSPEFIMEESDKTTRGTDIILHIGSEENNEFLEKHRIQELLTKYCKFLPVQIQFGHQFLSDEDKEAGKEAEPNIINNTNPAWTRKPADLTDEDYKAFYKELYPMSPDPLFWIHLNVDYPFHLTGILYFPELKQSYEVQKDKIQLYSNQVFVTDNLETIVPEYLALLHGVIDSPDIPLNVSRSYLQSDVNVKKINSHISKKVSDKLKELFKKDRPAFEEKWDSISVFVKYGMLSDEKFYDRSKEFSLLANVDGELSTQEEYTEKVKDNQTDKDENVIYLYTTDPEGQHAYIKAAKDNSFDILKMDTIIDSHFVNFMESKLEKTNFKRVDADTVDNLIPKGEERESVLSEDQQTKVKELFEGSVGNPQVMIELKPMSPTDAPVTITRNEFMRRMMDMQKLGGNQMMGNMPDSFTLVVNTNHPLTSKILKKRQDNKTKMVKQLYDLALLSQNMLKGEALTEFVERSFDLASE
ncbi:MAG: molecular chaperone HtpG [Bacteroidetes bacterium]|nr:molecular chaperone HtpG [Bacteroidota bacterium]